MRQQQGIIRPGLINLLIQAREGKISHDSDKENEKIVDSFATVQVSQVGKRTITINWEDDDLVPQCFIFFFAGLN